VTPAPVRTLRRRLDPETLRAAWWTLRTLPRVRADLRTSGIDTVRVAAPPALEPGAVAGVEAVLRRRPHSCLERSLILQRWHAEHGQPLDVVIGVAGASEGFRAHAWLDGRAESDGFSELKRLSP
jgi:hypothetical protein